MRCARGIKRWRPAASCHLQRSNPVPGRRRCEGAAQAPVAHSESWLLAAPSRYPDTRTRHLDSSTAFRASSSWGSRYISLRRQTSVPSSNVRDAPSDGWYTRPAFSYSPSPTPLTLGSVSPIHWFFRPSALVRKYRSAGTVRLHISPSRGGGGEIETGGSTTSPDLVTIFRLLRTKDGGTP